SFGRSTRPQSKSVERETTSEKRQTRLMEIAIYSRGNGNQVLDRIRSRSLQTNPEIVARVTRIVESVRSGGDEALIHFTEQFDGVTLDSNQLRVEAEFIRDA